MSGIFTHNTNKEIPLEREGRLTFDMKMKSINSNQLFDTTTHSNDTKKDIPSLLNSQYFFFLLHSQCTYFGQYITGTKITSICTISLGSRLEGLKVPKYIYTLSRIQTIYSRQETPFTIEIVDISYRQFMLSDPTMDHMRCFTFVFSKNSPE